MEAAGYNNPCSNDSDLLIGGDNETINMKMLYERCYQQYPDTYITRAQIKQIAQPEDFELENQLFPWMNLSEMSGQVKFGNQLSRFIGRILSDIRLEVESKQARGTLQKYKFTKDLYKESESFKY